MVRTSEPIEVSALNMLFHEDVILRRPTPTEAGALYQLMVTDEKWTEFNGPYFGYERPSFPIFLETTFARLTKGEDALAIEYKSRLVGSVTSYWECERTRWLEAGIVIYDSHLWGKGLGRKAIVPWVTYLFDNLELERIGMTTWSGNPRMIQSAIRVGFTIEGTLRKVRYFKGIYYDSIRLGVTRDEWKTLYPKSY